MKKLIILIALFSINTYGQNLPFFNANVTTGYCLGIVSTTFQVTDPTTHITAPYLTHLAFTGVATSIGSLVSQTWTNSPGVYVPTLGSYVAQPGEVCGVCSCTPTTITTICSHSGSFACNAGNTEQMKERKIIKMYNQG